MIRNTASQTISARLNALSDGLAVTSGTTTVFVTKDNGTQATGAGTVTHEGNGEWSYVPTQAETDAVQVSFMFTNSLAIGVLINVYTRPSGTGFPAVDASQRVDVGEIMGVVLTLSGNVVTIPAGLRLAPTTNTVAALRLVGAPNGYALDIAGGGYEAIADSSKGAIRVAMISDGGIDTPLVEIQKGATSTTAITSNGTIDANIVGNITGTITTTTNLTTNNDKTGYSLTAGTGLGNQTANITGNLSGSVGSISGVAFPSNFSALGINASGHISRVTLVDNSTAAPDSAGTTTLLTRLTSTRAGYLDNIATAAPTAAQNAAALLDLTDGIETNITPRGAFRLILAASAGKLSGAATTTVAIRNVGDTKTRLSATVDSDGNRTAVTTDVT